MSGEVRRAVMCPQQHLLLWTHQHGSLHLSVKDTYSRFLRQTEYTLDLLVVLPVPDGIILNQITLDNFIIHIVLEFKTTELLKFHIYFLLNYWAKRKTKYEIRFLFSLYICMKTDFSRLHTNTLLS